MTDVIFEAVALGVDSVISGSVVSMIVLVLTLSSKLNAYAAMQETYAQSITYYRQYSKYNNTEVVSADALSALFYYDSNMDIFIVDANFDAEDESARGVWVYAKEDGIVKSYKAGFTVDEVNSTYTVKYTGKNITYPFGSEADIAASAYEQYLNGIVPEYKVDGSYLTYTKISAQMEADRVFKARLLEDLSTRPDGMYKGGTVTGIVMTLK